MNPQIKKSENEFSMYFKFDDKGKLRILEHEVVPIIADKIAALNSKSEELEKKLYEKSVTLSYRVEELEKRLAEMNMRIEEPMKKFPLLNARIDELEKKLPNWMQ